MRIALVSYEFPPDTAVGGIATFNYHMAKSLQQLHCDVEVFSASPARESINENFEGITVHRVQTDKREIFRRAMIDVLKMRHTSKPFDLVECPEYGAEGMFVKNAFPGVPLVVRFHSPSFLIRQINKSLKAGTLKYKLKNFAGLGKYKKEKDAEYLAALNADALVAPSTSMAQQVAQNWKIDANKISVIPSPFIAPQDLLEISADTTTNTVTYFGRLEVRKGVHLLADAIPLILEKHPDIHFRFVGRTNVDPFGKGAMIDYLKKKLQPCLNRIEFIDQVPMKEIPRWLASTDICVFPSLWEAFGYVCLEAMAAARGIVASRFGGMHDMLCDVDEQLLVDPKDAAALANAIIALISSPDRRIEIGLKSRQKVADYYGNTAPLLNHRFYRNVIRKIAPGPDDSRFSSTSGNQ